MVKLFDWDRRKSQIALVFSLLLTLLIYYLLHCCYILYNGDESWTLSRVYHFITTGNNYDTVFRAVETTDRVQLFGISYNSLTGTFLNSFGWTKTNAHLVSIFFIFSSSLVWFHILRCLRFSSSLSWVFATSMLLFPAYFGAGNMARTDAMVLFFASSSLYCFISERYFWSGLLLMIGTEVHIIGSIGAFYILAYFLYDLGKFTRQPKVFLKMLATFSLGALLGLAYYLFLHRHVFSVELLLHLLFSHRDKGLELPSYLLTYFVQPEWYLHVTELVLLLSMIVLYLFKKAYKGHRFVWIFLLVLLGSTFILSRPNRLYMLFLFPALHLVILYTAEHLKILKTFTICLYLGFVLHYGWIYSMNGSYNFQNSIEQMQAAMIDPDIAVVGVADVWLAAKERDFHLIYNTIKDLPERNIKETYLVQTDYMHPESWSIELEQMAIDRGFTKDPLLQKRRKHYQDQIAYFKNNYDCQLISADRCYKQDSLRIWHCTR